MLLLPCQLNSRALLVSKGLHFWKVELRTFSSTTPATVRICIGRLRRCTTRRPLCQDAPVGTLIAISKYKTLAVRPDLPRW
jgi:hypothetical protein